MRTTLSIDTNLLRSAKKKAQQLGLTLGELVERALRRELERPARPTARPEIPVFRGGTGVRPGVDASSMRGLLEALDRDQPIEKLR
jgi:hypothetical protein